MKISLPETLERFVRERIEAAHFDNPSDYVGSLIREDQRRQSAETLLAGLIAEHAAGDPGAGEANLATLRAEFWTRWNEMKGEIDKGLQSLHRDGGKELSAGLLDAVKRRGRERLARAKAV